MKTSRSCRSPLEWQSYLRANCCAASLQSYESQFVPRRQMLAPLTPPVPIRAFRTIRILGIPFLAMSAAEALELTLRGGLVLVPAAPPLAQDFLHNPDYRQAILDAEFVLPDSGAMVLVWNIFHCLSPRNRLSRLSGLEYLKALLVVLRERPNLKTFWIMPNQREQEINLRWLHSRGLTQVTAEQCYLAPKYPAPRPGERGAIRDETLVARLKQARPDVIVVNVGGGVQEQLGHYLRRELDFQTTIVCTGAAIAFLSGCQANIPDWADRYYFGWLLRIFQAPGKFGPRYFRALKIIWLLLRYRDQPPRMSAAPDI